MGKAGRPGEIAVQGHGLAFLFQRLAFRIRSQPLFKGIGRGVDIAHQSLYIIVARELLQHVEGDAPGSQQGNGRAPSAMGT